MAYDSYAPEMVIKRYRDLKSSFGERDEHHREVSLVRSGNGQELISDIWPSDTFPKSITANILDTAARDLGEMAGFLPQVSCQPARFTSQAAKKAAEKRTNVVLSYLDSSRFQPQMYQGGDWFFSYSALIVAVEPDWKNSRPALRTITPKGAYYTRNLHGEVASFYQCWDESVAQLCAMFPDLKEQIRGTEYTSLGVSHRRSDSDRLEVVKYQGPDKSCVFLPDEELTLSEAPNPMNRTPIFIAERIRWDECARGQFDQMLWVQLARARMALYGMEVVDQSVNAPIVVPNDVDDIDLDSRGIIHTDNRQGVGRVELPIPQGAFVENELLQREERLAARYPEGMTGNFDASIITGSAVNSLLNQVNTQLKVAQELFSYCLQDALAFALEMDEKFWPDVEKTAKGTSSGKRFAERYTPSKDIAGEYGVQATYGHLFGLDPSRALVYALQLQGAGAMSRDTLLRLQGHLKGIDPTQEIERIDIERMEEALLASVMGTAQNIPMMAQAGQNPVQLINQIATAIRERAKGRSVTDAVLKAFEPSEEELAAAEDPFADAMAGGMPGAPPGGGGGGPEDLMMMLSGLSQSGAPNLQANVSRMIPTQGSGRGG